MPPGKRPAAPAGTTGGHSPAAEVESALAWLESHATKAARDGMVARRLAASGDATARWVGKSAPAELASAAVTARLAMKARGTK